jgi:hypothetical protein
MEENIAGTGKSVTKRARPVVSQLEGGAYLTEGDKNALRWAWLSCRRTFRDNTARLQLFALAHNFPTPAARRSLGMLRGKLVKIGAQVVRYGRCVVFRLADPAVPRALSAAILRRVDRLRGPPVAAARRERALRRAKPGENHAPRSTGATRADRSSPPTRVRWLLLPGVRRPTSLPVDR